MASSPETNATVERLREFWPDGFDPGDVAALCEDAAAEIERLQAALHEIATGSRANARRLAYAALGMTREANDEQY